MEKKKNKKRGYNVITIFFFINTIKNKTDLDTDYQLK